VKVGTHGADPTRLRDVIAIATAHLQRRAALAGRALLAALIIVSVSMIGTGTAWAFGNAALDQHIISNPVPGWGLGPTSVLQSTQNQISTTLNAKTHEKVQVAVEGWGPTTSSNDFIFIILVGFPGTSVPSSYSLSAEVNGVCSGGGGTPGTIFPVAGIPGSDSESCQSSNGSTVTGVAWKQANVLALIDSGGLTSSQTDSISEKEAAQLPSGGIGESSSSSSSSILGVVGVVVVAAIIIGVILMNRRRTASRAQPAVAGDWVAQGGAPAPQWGPGGAAQDPYGGGAAPPYGGGGYQQPPVDAGQAGQPAAQSPFGGGGSYGSAAGPMASPMFSDDATVSAGPLAPPPDAGAPAPAGPAAGQPIEVGWHPVEGDPNRQQYWDGAEWTAHLRWDGTAWVDES
jgi:hypothetical protein